MWTLSDGASMIAPGSAATLSRAEVEVAIGALEVSAAPVIQCELLVDVTTHAAMKAKQNGNCVNLNAPPAAKSSSDISLELMASVSMLVVICAEAGHLLGTHPKN
jgi:sugar/nucleoside kinase (ribokinase family)